MFLLSNVYTFMSVCGSMVFRNVEQMNYIHSGYDSFLITARRFTSVYHYIFWTQDTWDTFGNGKRQQAVRGNAFKYSTTLVRNGLILEIQQHNSLNT